MKKGLTIAGVAIVLAGTVFTGIHFLSHKTVATNANYTAVVESYHSDESSAAYDAAEKIAQETNLSFNLSDALDGTQKTTDAAVNGEESATGLGDEDDTGQEAAEQDATVENTTELAEAGGDSVATETETQKVQTATQAATQNATQAATQNATQAATQNATPAATQAATQAPTAAPTEAATQAPIAAPTAAPTEAATQAPTAAPTEAATQAPTAAPTAAPTEAATQAPTQAVVADYTNVKFTDGATGQVYTFATLSEAKASLNVATLSADQAKAQGAINKSAYAASITDLIDQINAYRVSLGLGTVTYNDNLTNAAMERAAESAYANWNMTAYEGNSKRHIRPNYTKASTIASEYGVSGNFAEIYARFQWTTGEALSGWQNSSAHNAVLTSGSYTQIGVGIAQDSDGYYYWICLFN